MEEKSRHQPWLTIRVGRSTLSFAMQASDGSVMFEPYVVKSGVSLAANLREAFKNSQLLLTETPRVRVLIDSPVLVVPIEIFEEDQMEMLYRHAYPDSRQDAIFYNVLPDLNAVAVFSMNKDLRLVIEDHYQMVRIIAAVSPVWRNLHRRSYTGPRNKLYGYFHEKRLDVCSFKQNRFKFCNAFETGNAHDALYFLLYVWNQLKLHSAFDELHIVGDIPQRDWLMEELKKYVQKVYAINPAADLSPTIAEQGTGNGIAKVTDIKGMPYDMQTLFVKGR